MLEEEEEEEGEGVGEGRELDLKGLVRGRDLRGVGDE